MLNYNIFDFERFKRNFLDHSSLPSSRWLATLARSLILYFEQHLSFCCKTTFLFIFNWYFFEHNFLKITQHEISFYFFFLVFGAWFFENQAPKTTPVFRTLSMIFEKNAHLVWFWFFFGRSQTSPNSWRHENCDVTILN